MIHKIINQLKPGVIFVNNVPFTILTPQSNNNKHKVALPTAESHLSLVQCNQANFLLFSATELNRLMFIVLCQLGRHVTPAEQIWNPDPELEGLGELIIPRVN